MPARPRVTLLVAATLTLMATGLPSGAANASKTLRCRSADLRYPYRPGGPRTFGVFKLQVTGGRCTRAHRVAKEWMRRFEADIRKGRVRLPRAVDGFAFKTLKPHAAQTYTERGKRRTTTIRFDYVVPNG
jgi:hypothetical protein